MRKTSLLALALVVAMVAAPGCAYHYKFKTDRPPAQDKAEVTEWKSIGLWGWISPGYFDLETACPEGVSEFGSYVSFPNWLCAFFSLGLYTPRTAYAIPAAS
jgi:Bor protein